MLDENKQGPRYFDSRAYGNVISENKLGEPQTA